MMRIAPLLLLAACDDLTWGPPSAPVSEQGLLMTTASAWGDLDSVAVSDDGENFWAVMAATTWCSFNSDSGVMENDVATENEIVVHDVYEYTPLISQDRGLAFIDEHGNTYPYWNVAGVRDARFRESGTGAVVTTDSGNLHWYDEVADEVVTQSVGACNALDLDRAGDVAWLGCESGLVRATSTTVDSFALGNIHNVAWSEAAGVVAAVADGQLIGLDAAGEELWSVSTTGRVLDLVALPEREIFAVLVKQGGSRALTLVDAASGAELDRLGTDGDNLRAARLQDRLVVYGDLGARVFDVQ
jgi:hypothetical protein